MREAGILDFLTRQNDFNSTFCQVPPGKESGLKTRVLTIEDFLGMFFVLFAGMPLFFIQSHIYEPFQVSSRPLEFFCSNICLR